MVTVCAITRVCGSRPQRRLVSPPVALSRRGSGVDDPGALSRPAPRDVLREDAARVRNMGSFAGAGLPGSGCKIQFRKTLGASVLGFDRHFRHHISGPAAGLARDAIRYRARAVSSGRRRTARAHPGARRLVGPPQIELPKCRRDRDPSILIQSTAAASRFHDQEIRPLFARPGAGGADPAPGATARKLPEDP